MASPARSVNARDPSGLRRFEDASAKEITAAVENAVNRIADSLGENPTAREIQAAVDREASAFSAETRAMLTKDLTETYRRSTVRAGQLMDGEGNLTDEATLARLQDFLAGFSAFAAGKA